MLVMTSREIEAQKRIAARADVSRETMADLDRFVALLRRWTQRISLISKGDSERIWSRHIEESLLLTPWLKGETGASEAEPQRWADLGSGGGLPVLPLAILAKRVAPDIEFIAIESDHRKAAFIAQAAIECRVPVRVDAKRIEDVHDHGFDRVSARALADVSQLVTWSEQLLSAKGRMIFLKGSRISREIHHVATRSAVRYQLIGHNHADRANILVMEAVSRVGCR